MGESSAIIGVPDRIVILPGNTIGFVETKKLKGLARTVQKRQIKKLRDLGCLVEIVDSEKRIDDFLEELKNYERDI